MAIFWSTIIALTCLILEVENASLNGTYRCVRIERVKEEYIAGSWTLQVEFEPFPCPGHFHLDSRTIQHGYQPVDTNLAFFSEMKTHLDHRYLQVGTELAIYEDSRAKRAIQLAPLFFSFGGALLATITTLILNSGGPVNKSPIKHVVHRVEDSNYLEQLRLQEIKDAEYKLRKANEKALELAKSMDPNQVAPAKKSGRQGQWCTAVGSKAIVLNNNNPSASHSAQGIGPAGNGPTPPPTPRWSKGTPAPRIITQAPRKRKNNVPFIRDPKSKRIQSNVVVQARINPNLDIEVVQIDDESDDDIIVLPTETIVSARPGSSLVVNSRVCQTNNPTGLSHYDHFRDTEVNFIRNSPTVFDVPDSPTVFDVPDSPTVFDVPDSPTVFDVPDSPQPGSRLQVFSRVIATLAPTRTQMHFPTNLNSIQPNYQWRGNRWGSQSDPIENTCIIDSFLSHVIYIARRNPAYFYHVLRLTNSRAESAIREIISTANSNDYSPRQRSNLIHDHWVSAFPEIFTRVSQNDGHINIAGSETSSIVLPMANSSQIWIAHHCNCANTESRLLRVEDDNGIVWSANTIGWFQSISFPNTPRTDATNMECDQCLSNYRAVRGFVSESTWHHNFYLREENQQDSLFDFDSYPRTLVFEELVTGNTVYFDLGFFSISTPFRMIPVSNPRPGQSRFHVPLQHQTSVHFIEGQGWRYYDGMQNGGQLQDLPDLSSKTHDVKSVTYFRRVLPKDH